MDTPVNTTINGDPLNELPRFAAPQDDTTIFFINQRYFDNFNGLFPGTVTLDRDRVIAQTSPQQPPEPEPTRCCSRCGITQPESSYKPYARGRQRRSTGPRSELVRGESRKRYTICQGCRSNIAKLTAAKRRVKLAAQGRLYSDGRIAEAIRILKGGDENKMQTELAPLGSRKRGQQMLKRQSDIKRAMTILGLKAPVGPPHKPHSKARLEMGLAGIAATNPNIAQMLVDMVIA